MRCVSNSLYSVPYLIKAIKGVPFWSRLWLLVTGINEYLMEMLTTHKRGVSEIEGILPKGRIPSRCTTGYDMPPGGHGRDFDFPHWILCVIYFTNHINIVSQETI